MADTIDIKNADTVAAAIDRNTEALDELNSALYDIRDALIDREKVQEELRAICRMLGELTQVIETAAASITRELRK